MRINSINAMSQAYNSSKAKKLQSTSGTANSKDTVAFSPFAKELSIAKTAVEQAPDVRQAKVDEIKQQMEAGNYNVTAAQIADKLLKG